MAPDTCSIIPEKAAAFIHRLRTVEAEGRQIPLTASIDLTERCNLHCIHCYIRKETIPGELNTRQWCAILDKLAEAGVLFLVLTGGEPLVRRDFAAIYLHAKKCGFIISLYTNGTMVDSTIADLLWKFPPRRVEITLYGYTPATYSRVTGSPDGHRRARNGIRLLRGAGITVLIKAMLLRANIAEFNAMRRWARRQECGFRYDAIVHPKLDGDRKPLKQRLDAETVVRHHFAMPQDRREFAAYIKNTDDQMGTRRRLFECGAGTMTMHIDATGKAHPCMLWRSDPFKVSGRFLWSDWHSHIAKLRSRLAPNGKCRTCADRGICSGCPPLVKLESGHAGRPALFYCRLAQARRQYFAKTKPGP